jgi:hypothetical protein
MHILGAFVRGSHKSNMQSLKQALAAETWGATAAAAGAAGRAEAPDATCLQQSLGGKAYDFAAFGQPGFVSDFAEGVKAGNPFMKQGRAVGGGCAAVAQGYRKGVRTTSASVLRCYRIYNTCCSWCHALLC